MYVWNKALYAVGLYAELFRSKQCKWPQYQGGQHNNQLNHDFKWSVMGT